MECDKCLFKAMNTCPGKEECEELCWMQNFWKDNNEKDYDLKCPYCGSVGDYCDFPDLFYDNADNTPELNEQATLQKEMWDVGFNIVTCGDCGQVFIHRTNENVR